MKRKLRSVGFITAGGNIKTPKGWRPYSKGSAKACGLKYDRANIPTEKELEQAEVHRVEKKVKYTTAELVLHRVEDPVKGRGEATWLSKNGVFMVRKTTAYGSYVSGIERIMALQVFEHNVFVKSCRKDSLQSAQDQVNRFISSRIAVEPEKKVVRQLNRLKQAEQFLQSRTFADFEVDYVTGYGGVDWKGIDACVWREAAGRVEMKIKEV